MADSKWVMWSSRALCITLWLGLLAIFCFGLVYGPPMPSPIRVAACIFAATIWLLMAAALGPIMWYVTELLPKRNEADT